MRSIGSVILRMSTWRFVERTNADSRYQKGKYVETLHIAANDCPLIQLSIHWSPNPVSLSLSAVLKMVEYHVELVSTQMKNGESLQKRMLSIVSITIQRNVQYPSINTLLDVKMFVCVHGSTANVASTWRSCCMVKMKQQRDMIEDLRRTRWQTSAKHNF